MCCNGRHISQLIKHPFLLLLPFNNLLSVLISAFYSLIFTKSFFLLVSCYKNVDILSYCAKNAYLGVVYIALNYNAFFLIGYNKKLDFGNIIMALCEQIMKIMIWIVCSFSTESFMNYFCNKSFQHDVWVGNEKYVLVFNHLMLYRKSHILQKIKINVIYEIMFENFCSQYDSHSSCFQFW